MKELPQISNCPFCGAVAFMKYWRLQCDEHTQRGAIACSKCDAAMGKEWCDIRCATRFDLDGELRAIKNWNNRTAQP